MHRKFLIVAFFLGAVSVAMGAFGAHALKAMIDEHALTVYDTAIRYQFYHVFALAMAAILYEKFPILIYYQCRSMFYNRYAFLLWIALFYSDYRSGYRYRMA
jgi:uncharacterized membrane protein YgdD (TMEM256/DUF423 family)